MQQALYHPQHGYYSSGRCTIGRAGDYFTNVSIGPVFGHLLAAQFLQIWEQLNKVDHFTIVEQGAHDGQFARDVLEFVQKRAPAFFAALRYQIVEPFPYLQERQRQTLEAFHHKVEWEEALQTFVGVHFSNELLDAMPVRLITHWGERLVGLDGDKFVFVERPVQKAIFNQAAIGWIDQHHFLSGIVSGLDCGDWDHFLMPLSPQAKRELQTLLHPEMLGRAFQVLALMKNVGPEARQLAGFKFAREPRSALNLDDSVQ